MKRLLVHLHIYYPDQTDFFLDKLNNISIPYQLVVTLTDDNDSIRKKISAKIPDTQFLIVENCGYDLYPFFQAMKQFDLSSYDYILKLHTKNSRNRLSLNHLHYYNNEFRDNLIAPLINTTSCFKRVFDILSSSPQTGIICSRFFIVMKEAPKNKPYTIKLCQDYNIPYNEEVPFCAGTMFMCKSEIVRFMLKNDYSATEYGYNQRTGNTGTLAHSMETFFGIVCQYLGYNIKGVQRGSKLRYIITFLIKCIAHKDIRWLMHY